MPPNGTIMLCARQRCRYPWNRPWEINRLLQNLKCSNNHGIGCGGAGKQVKPAGYRPSMTRIGHRWGFFEQAARKNKVISQKKKSPSLPHKWLLSFPTSVAASGSHGFVIYKIKRHSLFHFPPFAKLCISVKPWECGSSLCFFCWQHIFI